ncbi:hypothetical protein [Bradyrhizobium sp. G127]|uniref:hypothetical protein n=1 Tax=Bradyrhizobium sp. G127 TaxID=2904800 RepID=UPI001F19A438|nr:hypothetical protein [Bradyrhizobium sp. G127]MCF2523212.1 hypothetical protein [Bradyrhizobium sp. G127]
MTAFTAADKLHRLVKHALDSGAAASITEAQAMFAGYRIALRIDDVGVRDPHQQAALMTAVALARRVFLGGVTVSLQPGVPLHVPMPFGKTLAEAVVALGASIGAVPDNIPLIEFGGVPGARKTAFHVRAVFSGWRGGIVPAHFNAAPPPVSVMPLAPMLAASLAINEAFLYVSGQTGMAGRRAVGLSLWNPAPDCDWLAVQNDEPELRLLPSHLWLIGLGHLGQAYMWALGLLPYARSTDLRLLLQDVDIITPSTESTSILSDANLIGQMKTRSMAAWAERRGFITSIQERLFDASFSRQRGEPTAALCGLDNSLGRQALDQVGFDFVVEAGLGRGHQDFRALRLHTLPASRSAAQIWKADFQGEQLPDRPAYTQMLDKGELDRCGVTLLAGKAVGAPFVGAAAATLAIAELLRLLHGGPVHELIDLDLKFPEYRTVVLTKNDFGSLNPGYALVTP